MTAVSDTEFCSHGGSTGKASTAATALITLLATELGAPASESRPSTEPLGSPVRTA